MDSLDRMQEILDRVNETKQPPTLEEIEEIKEFFAHVRKMLTTMMDCYVSAISPVLETITAWWFSLDPMVKMQLQDLASNHGHSDLRVSKVSGIHDPGHSLNILINGKPPQPSLSPMGGVFSRQQFPDTTYRPNRYRGEEDMRAYLRSPNE